MTTATMEVSLHPSDRLSCSNLPAGGHPSHVTRRTGLGGVSPPDFPAGKRDLPCRHGMPILGIRRQHTRRMSVLVKTSVFVLALGVLSFPTASSTAWQSRPVKPHVVLTPANAVEILYSHVKRVDYLPLLDYSTGPEARRLQTLITNMKKDRSIESLIRRQAHELASYRIHQQEVHTNVAAIMFTWQYKRNTAPSRAHGRPAVVLVEEGCEALLVKKDRFWKIASVRPWVTENERGYTFLQRQQTNKNARNKK